MAVRKEILSVRLTTEEKKLVLERAKKMRMTPAEYILNLGDTSAIEHALVKISEDQAQSFTTQQESLAQVETSIESLLRAVADQQKQNFMLHHDHIFTMLNEYETANRAYLEKLLRDGL